MAIEIVTNFGVLLRLAREVAKAEKSGDIQAFKKVKAEHDAYKDLCLLADRMALGAHKSGLGF